MRMLRGNVACCVLLVSACALPALPSVPRYPTRSAKSSTAKPSVVTAKRASDEPSDTARKITEAALAAPSAYALLTELTDDIGARPAGSQALEQAIRWAETRLREAGHDVRVDPVMVSKWTRGEGSLSMVSPTTRDCDVLAIGHSVATPRGGIEADVVVVRSQDELTKLGDAVRDKIVLFEVVMPAYDAEHNDPGYGSVYWSRVHGASLAAKQGARAVLVRSLSVQSRAGVHTGTLAYDPAQPKIPAATVSIEDADWITRLVARGKTVRMKLTLSPKEESKVPSGNVLAELRGREKPAEIVLMGGHIDSWDVGQGAQDDGAGVVITMEALSLLRRLKLVPRRTIRAVLFTNEEAGGDGADAYAEMHGAEPHAAAIETDTGAARVVALGIDLRDNAAEPKLIEALEPMTSGLRALGLAHMRAGFAGADIAPLIKRGVPGIGLIHDVSHYFDVHHTKADTLDKIDPDQLQQGVAAMAVLAYTLAEMEGELPRGTATP